MSNNEKKQYRLLSAIVFGLLCIFLLYIIVFKDNIVVATWDNLDSNIAWLKMMKDNNLFFSCEKIAPFLGGIDRNYLYSDLKVYSWLYMLLPTYYALLLGWLMKIIISIIGFYFLGKELLGNNKTSIYVFCGLLYGIMPSFPVCALGFATLPLLLMFLVRMYRTNDCKYCILFFIYPIFSDFTLFGIFICGYMLLFFILDLIITKKPRYVFILALVVLSLGYVICEWRLFKVLLFSGVPTLKDDPNYLLSYLGIYESIKQGVNSFFNSSIHANCFHKYIILPVTILYVLPIPRNKRDKIITYNDSSIIIIKYCLSLIIFNCFIYGLDNSLAFHSLISSVFPFLDGFGFARTLWFNPLLWLIILMAILTSIKKEVTVSMLCIAMLGIECMINDPLNEIRHNIKYNYDVLFNRKTEITYKEFYSEDLFKEILEDINYQNEWSAAFGMHPSILEYSGIHTLDGYISYYPLEYKEKFRKIIAPELELDEESRKYFDIWGGRAYIYSNEVSYLETEDNYYVDSANMHINIEEFIKMDGKYIFSRVRIKNYIDLGLELKGVYNGQNSPYTIYVYSI